MQRCYPLPLYSHRVAERPSSPLKPRFPPSRGGPAYHITGLAGTPARAGAAQEAAPDEQRSEPIPEGYYHCSFSSNSIDRSS